jgi:hypothetical protein
MNAALFSETTSDGDAFEMFAFEDHQQARRELRRPFDPQRFFGASFEFTLKGTLLKIESVKTSAASVWSNDEIQFKSPLKACFLPGNENGVSKILSISLKTPQNCRHRSIGSL